MFTSLRKLGLIRWLLPSTAVALLALSPGCGGSTQRPSVPIQPAVPPQTAADPAGTAPRMMLNTHMPALNGIAVGAEFDFTVSSDCTDSLYQGSGRILYDPAALIPVAAVRGPALPGACLFAVKLDASPIAAPGIPGLPANCGVVPYAFTLLPQAQGQSIAAGRLFSIRFRVLQPCSSNAVQLLNNAAYLQLRDANGTRLAFGIATEVGT